ncbi:diacylglycerol kinase [Marinicella gelatinilytica]|uniref:diacylglycerol kinase n=1 Tax=Marinicella gelatinilytica TaxID=2996017 RepID=UPI002260E49D|nr:diacylglycerol kinase [Marinicella gelatinilytica]MCX7545920.1 diacylglycerol kinase [Marinicella gelatinilytica]
MADPTFRGPKQLLKAFQWTLQGFKSAYQVEASFRLEVWLFIVLLPVAVWLAQTPAQLFVLVVTGLLVLLVELINSAIEAVVDLVVGAKQHPLAGRAKDVGSAAVFLALCIYGLSWLLVIYQRFFV